MQTLKEQITETLQSIFDPEIPVSIWELGFIYDIDINEKNDVKILMTLTSPTCPVAETLPLEVQVKVAAIPDIGNVFVKITFDPPWSMDRISDAAKLELGLF